MASKAQLELQGLLDMQASGQAQASNSQKLLDARNDPELVGSGDAKFALPEALATAVGAGWLLGPVGGLLMGVAQGILGKKEQQSAIDAYAQDMGVLAETNDVFNDELDRLALSVTNENDLEQLSAMQTQKDAALQMMASASPELQARGSDMLGDFSARLNDYTLTQETQRIEAEAYDAQLKRELDDTQYSRYNSSIDSFRRESAPYEGVMQATDIALDALANGTPADLWAASILVNKALDPASIVRESEREALAGLGSLWDQANIMMEKARSGETLLPQQRKELSALLYSIRETGTQHQLARESRYSDEINDIGLPAKYHDNFRLATTVPAAAPGDMQVHTLPTEDIENIASDAIFPFTDEGIALNAKHAWGNFTNWIRGGSNEREAALRKRQLEQAGQ